MAKRTRKSSASSGEAFLDRINGVKLSKRELLKFNEAFNELPTDQRDFFGQSFLAVRLTRRRPDKAAALIFRMQALARLVCDDGARGWTLPKQPDGAIFTKEEMFQAAALEPLIERKGEFAFEHDSFLQRVLALAEVETRPT